MKKAQKESKVKKVGKPLKDFLPQNLKSTVREGLSLKPVENFNRNFVPFYEAHSIPEEWPSEEDLKTFEFGVCSETFFEDNLEDIVLPYSISAETMSEIKWLRPCEYVRDYYIEKEIKQRMPSRNPIKLRKRITEIFAAKGFSTSQTMKTVEKKFTVFNEGVKSFKGPLTRRSVTLNVFSEKEEDVVSQMELLKEYEKFIEKDYKMKIIKFFERDETEEEFEARKNLYESKKLKDQQVRPEKDKKIIAKKDKTETVLPVIQKGKVKEYLPSDLNMTGKYPKYSKWLCSIFQFIKDMDLRDVNTGEKIWSKIYPQSDGMPVYNPSGLYWVKLYFMGRYRKIVIDDRMPCGMYEEFLLPKCEAIEELWPSILSKALIKLFSYKYKCSDFIYEEVGDASPIYALTGYLGEKVTLNLNLSEKLDYDSSYTDLISTSGESEGIKILSSMLSDSCYEKKQKFLLGFNSSVPFEDQKFGFSNVLRENIFPEKTFSPKLKVRRPTIITTQFQEDKTKKLPPKLLKTLTKRNSITMEHLVLNPTELNTVQETEFQDNTIKASHKATLSNQLSSISNQTSLISITKSPALSLSKRKSFNKMGASTKTTLNLISVPPQNEVSACLDSHDNSPNLKYNSDVISPTPLLNVVTLNATTPGMSFLNTNKRRLSSTRTAVFVANERREDRIYLDFAYSLVEVFCSEQFNMLRLKPVDFSDLKKKLMDARVSYKQLSKEEKKHYIQNLKELKAKQNEEKARRLKDLEKPGIRFYLMKIKSDCLDRKSAPLNILLDFNDKEIEMAKTCLLNSWNYPPPSFFQETFISPQDLNVTHLHDEHHSKKHELQSLNWTEEFYTEQILHNQLENYENINLPKARQNGLWLNMKNFSEMFKYFIVLHNPKFYPYQLRVDNSKFNFSQDIYSSDPDYAVFNLLPGDKSENIKNNKVNLGKSCVLILFEPNTSNQKTHTSDQFRDLNFYLDFDIRNSHGESVLDNKTICLSSFFSVFQYDHLNPNEEYFLIIKGSITPFGYYMKVLSDHRIESMSYQSFLKRLLKFYNYNFSFTLPPMKENEFYLLSKIRANFTIADDSLLLITSKLQDNYFKQFIEIYLIYDEESSYCKRRILFDKELNLSLIFEDTKKNPEPEVYFVICCTAPFNINETVFDIEFLTTIENIKFEQFENIEPYEISDYFQANKHGYVCKELVYVPFETEVLATFQFKLLINNQPISDKIRMRVDISRGEEELLSQDFFNTLTAHNIIFDNTRIPLDDELKKMEATQAIRKTSTNKLPNSVPSIANTPFNLFWLVDLTECPEYLKNKAEGVKVTWSMKIFSSDSIAFVKNTLKEDSERAMKESWEMNEPGRAEIASIARVKFLMQLRKEKGEQLTAEEEGLLMKVRKRKNKTMITNIVSKEQEKKPTGKKDNNNSNNNNKINSNTVLAEVEQDSVDNYNTKTLPKSTDHHSSFLKNFLDYTYDKRVFEKGYKTPSGNAAPFCRSEEQLEALKEEIELKAETSNVQILKEIYAGLKDKNQLSEGLSKNYKSVYKKRNDKKMKYLNELQKRNNLRESLINSESK